ncbi:MAG: hypothetical protein OHK0015_12700 [Chloroflexi bacterium OHK40]
MNGRDASLNGVEPAALDQLRLIADESRWRILQLLRQSDYLVMELVERTGLAQNLVSYHLNSLRQAGLIQVHRSAWLRTKWLAKRLVVSKVTQQIGWWHWYLGHVVKCALGTVIRVWLPWSVALTLGLLVPLACVVHCRNFSAAHPFRIRDSSGLLFFLCDHPPVASGTAGLGHHEHLLPRPVCEMALFGVLIVLAAVAPTPLVHPRNEASPLFSSDAPPTPPPRVHSLHPYFPRSL